MKYIYSANKEKILKAWKKKPIFLHYTGHMYGIGCGAFQKENCEKINSYKKRADGKGFIILIPSSTWLERYNLTSHKNNQTLPIQYWPGNITMILNDTENIFPHISIDGKVAVRVPDDANLRKFISIIDQPIVSTSVNESGEPPLNDVDKIVQKNWCDLAFIPKIYVAGDMQPSTIIDATLEKVKSLREGAFSLEDIVISAKNPRILFICTGNICRSPMAEYIAKKIVEERALKYSVSSAGFIETGRAISENSSIVLAENGYDAKSHLSTLISKKLLANSFLIMTMTKEHKKKLQKMDPALGDKLFTLSEFIGNSDDISDPYGLSIAHYRKTFAIIQKKIELMMSRL